jgi:C1A family cysteine protease
MNKKRYFLIGILVLGASLAVSLAETSQLPKGFDWRAKGIITPVKNQGSFGACGVFAAIGIFEALIKKETGCTVDLSEQHIINGSADWKSSGMSAPSACKFMKENGIVLEKHLPYQAARTAAKPDHVYDFILTDYKTVETHGLPLLKKIELFKDAIYKYGPVATNMNVYKDYDAYKSGIYVWDGKSKEIGGHWVLVVGWQDDPSVKNGGYWICKNSDLPSSDSGYMKIAYGEAGIDDYWFCYGIYEKGVAPRYPADNN